MPRAHDLHAVTADRLPSKSMGGPIPDFGWDRDWDDPLGMFVENLLQQIKDWTGIDLFWLLDWSWMTNTIMELIRQATDLMSWLQNPIQRPPNLLSRPSFSSPSAIAAAPDWSWDPVVSLGTLDGPDGRPRTDPQGSARTIADGSVHSMLSNAISESSAVSPGQILTCQIHVLVEAGFTAADDQAIRLELVPSRLGVLGESVVLASCGVPTGAPTDWVAAPVGSKAVFFDVDYEVPKTGDIPDTVELRLVVGESAGGDVPVRFDGARVAAAGGFLVVLTDLFDAGRQYLADVWAAVEVWFGDVFHASAWATLKADTDAAWVLFVKRVKRALRHADADSYVPPKTSGIISEALRSNPWFGWLFQMIDDTLQPVLRVVKACVEFGDSCWQAIASFVSNVFAPNAWQTMVSTIETAWDLFIRKVFVSWGATEEQAEAKAQLMPTPAEATKSALFNNPVTGWVFRIIDLVDTFFKRLIGQKTQAQLTAAWDALVVSMGIDAPDTSSLMKDLISTWLLPDWLPPWMIGGGSTGGATLDETIGGFINSVVLGASGGGATGNAFVDIGDAFNAMWQAIFKAQDTANEALGSSPSPPGATMNTYATPGTYSLPVPAGMKAQMQGIGAGGGGASFQLFMGGKGGKGGAGVYGEAVGPTTVTITVGAGGAGNYSASNSGKGSPGGETKFEWGGTVRRASGGAGGSGNSLNFPDLYGGAAATVNHFPGMTSIGGGTQTVGGLDGIGPGGGGAGQGLGLGPVGAGAPGRAWVMVLPV